MARRIKYNSVTRQLYQMSRDILRNQDYPDLTTPLSPLTLRARGFRDEEIAALFDCTVEEIDSIIAFDNETRETLMANEKVFNARFAEADRRISAMEVSISVMKDGVGKKKKRH